MSTRSTLSTGAGSDPARKEPGVASKGCCNVEFQIDARGDVNIYNCSAPGKSPAPTCPPALPGGTCLPVAAGAKHKQGGGQKLAGLAGRAQAPSALATSTLHMARRFLLGKPAANPLEAAVFGVLSRLPEPLRDTMSCAVSAFDALPPRQRSRLFVDSLILDPDQAIDAEMLSKAWTREIADRVGALVLGDAQAVEEERPGRPRVYCPTGEDFFSQVRICRVNDLRTANYIPSLAAGDLLPSEVQQDCSPVLVDGQVQVVCQVRTADCPGHSKDGVCARVPEVAAGDGVVLEGVNYFSVDARVRLTLSPNGGLTREVDAHVWGDLDTEVTEVIDGETRLINDCRVHDRLTFRVPDDLPPGIYQIQVVVPNTTGLACLGNELVSNVEFINVTPPPSARFQIATETLHARAETSPAWLGSDEVGLRMIAMPLLADLSTGAPTVIGDISLGDVDSGETRNIARVLFAQQQPIAGVALSILGHEIDSEEAYEKMITSFTDVFIDLVKEQAQFIKAALAAAGGAALLGKLGPAGWVAVAIGAAVTLAIDLIVALWAPADLIIEDGIGLSTTELVALTSPNFPAPAASTYPTEGGLQVKTTPLDKIPQQYRERREYHSEDEDSRYEIIYRFNRLA